LTEYLLDANALIDWLKGRPPAVALLIGLVEQGDILATNAIVIAETFSGLSGAEQIAAETVLSHLEYWLIDIAVARRAGAIRYDYARKGQKIGVADAIVAAHALVREATLVTDNLRDFPTHGLKVLRIR
jgi:predicted nucleic acid-binding protein